MSDIESGNHVLLSAGDTMREIVKLRDAIENREQGDAAKPSRDDFCPWCHWIYGDGQRLATCPAFTDLVQIHNRFHSVAELINRRDYRQAEDALTGRD